MIKLISFWYAIDVLKQVMFTKIISMFIYMCSHIYTLFSKMIMCYFYKQKNARNKNDHNPL